MQLLWGFGGGGESFPEKPGPGLDPRLIGGPGYGGLFPFLALLTTEEPQTVQGKGVSWQHPGLHIVSQGDFSEAKRVGSQACCEVRPGDWGLGSVTLKSRKAPRGTPWYSVIDLVIQERI